MNEHGKNEYSEFIIQFASLLNALSHPARLTIVEHLAGYKECSAGTISKKLPICKSTVSQHMAKLREAGLIVCNQQGTCLEYRLNEKKIEDTWELFKSFMQEIRVTSKNKKECCPSL